MSIASAVSRNDYIGNGSTDTYNYNFKILAESHLEVTVRDTLDVETQYVLNTDYTVTDVGEDAGGTIVLVAGNLANNYVLTIRRIPPLTQLTDIRNQGDFFPEVHENTFDKLVMNDQMLQEQISRQIVMPVTISPSDFDPTLPSDLMTAGSVPMVNVTEDGWIMAPQSQAAAQAALAAAQAAAAAAAVDAAAAAADAAQAAADLASYLASSPEYDNGNSGASITINFATRQNQRVTLTANCTFTFSNPVAGYSYKLKVIQDGTGSRTVTWPASVEFTDGTAPTLTTTAGREDMFTFYYDGTSYIAQYDLNYDLP